MYEDYYGFTEKPFSLTPDPKYLYKSASHASAFELLQRIIGLELLVLLHRGKFTRKEIIEGLLVDFEL